ncbi:MAG: hypothetical protein WC865_03180 [Bacteroidales bacterium]
MQSNQFDHPLDVFFIYAFNAANYFEVLLQAEVRVKVRRLYQGADSPVGCRFLK